MDCNDHVLRPGGLALTERLVALSAFVPSHKVVDIGCGTGVTVEYLRAVYGIDAIGVDIDAERVSQGNKRIVGSPLIQASGEALPFYAASMNGVLAECSLSVMDSVQTVIAESCRVLLPGAKLAVSDLYLRTGSNRPAGGDERDAGIFDHEQLSKLLARHGFTVLVWEDHSVVLKEYVAKYIMKYGLVDPLWQSIAVRLPAALKPASLGYFLLVAKKL